MRTSVLVALALCAVLSPPSLFGFAGSQRWRDGFVPNIIVDSDSPRALRTRLGERGLLVAVQSALETWRVESLAVRVGAWKAIDNISTNTALREVLTQRAGEPGILVVVDDDGSMYRERVRPEEHDKPAVTQTYGLTSDRRFYTRRVITLKFDGPVESESQLHSLLVHEIGHALGMTHSFANQMASGDEDNHAGVPMMAPRFFGWDLRADDVSWFRVLTGTDELGPQHRWLTGRVTTAAGDDVPGAHVTAVEFEKGRPMETSTLRHYGGVSGVPDGTGAFRIPVPLGNYRLRVDPLNANIELAGVTGDFYTLTKAAVRSEAFDRVHIVGSGTLPYQAGDLVVNLVPQTPKPK